MPTQQNTDHIQTTHIGSLPRPHDVLDLMKAKYSGKAYDEKELDALVAKGVRDSVKAQVEAGVEIVTDGEISKPGFYTYIQERIAGFEMRPGVRMPQFRKELAAFPEYYEQYFAQIMLGGAVVSMSPVICVGPVKYRGENAVEADIRNLKAAASEVGLQNDQLFLPATAPAGVGINEYYKTEEEYLHALAGELHKEYKAILDAGILLQIDDPFLTDIFVDPDLDVIQMKKRAQIYVEATNAALKGLPSERVRFHTCYGINHGPRIHEAGLADVIDYMFQINAGSYSFEAANSRHEHEYKLFETIKVPDGKVICPGVITHSSNIVEHPETVADRLLRFAKLVGRKNVMAGADCGFSSQALYKTEVHPTVIWAKFRALREGADIATKKLWS